MLDILIKNARVIDGSGSPWYLADVGVKDGRIAMIRRNIDIEATSVIDATRKVVTPGIVDIHSHIDKTIYSSPKAESSVKQGITTQAGGNCGIAPAPSAECAEGFWPSLEDFFEAIKKQGMGINMAQFVGHGAVREYVMGSEGEGGEKPVPSASELECMKNEVRKAMAAGCFGFTTGLQYPPGRNALTDELAALMQSAAPGIYMSHIRDQQHHIIEAVEEVIEIARRTNSRAIVSHLKTTKSGQWGWSSRILQMFEAARHEGIDILCDAYPWPYSGVNYMHKGILPPWVYEGGVDAMVALMREPSTRDRIRKDIQTGLPGWTNSVRVRGWANHTVVFSTDPDVQGKDLEALSVEFGKDAVDVVADLVIQDRGETRTCANTMSEDDVRRILAHPLCVISTDSTAHDGLSAGAAHPRNLGTYPRVFAKYVREEKLFSLEEAVRKCTFMPASVLGINDRGVLLPGTWADILVFDPHTIDYPGSFADPMHYPVGIDAVIVNGRIAVQDGEHTGVLAGTVLGYQR